MATDRNKAHEGWVVYLDVFGFSSMIKADDKDKTILKLNQKLSSCYKNTNKILSFVTETAPQLFVFSDCLFIFFPVNAPEKKSVILHKCIESTSQVLTKNMDSDLPLRGGISYGRISYSFNMLVGVPVLKAYHDEQSVSAPLVILKKEYLLQIEGDNQGLLPFCDHIIKMKDGITKGCFIYPHRKKRYHEYVKNKFDYHATYGPPGVAAAWFEALKYIEDNMEVFDK